MKKGRLGAEAFRSFLMNQGTLGGHLLVSSLVRQFTLDLFYSFSLGLGS